MDASWPGAALATALVAAALAARGARWWKRRRDPASLAALATGLNLTLVAGAAAVLFTRAGGLRSDAVVVWSTLAWTSLVTWRATLAVLPEGGPEATRAAVLLVRAPLVGGASGLAILLGLGAALALTGGAAALPLLLMAGGVVALAVGLVTGFVVGLADLALLLALKRGAR